MLSYKNYSITYVTHKSVILKTSTMHMTRLSFILFFTKEIFIILSYPPYICRHHSSKATLPLFFIYQPSGPQTMHSEAKLRTHERNPHRIYRQHLSNGTQHTLQWPIQLRYNESPPYITHLPGFHLNYSGEGNLITFTY